MSSKKEKRKGREGKYGKTFRRKKKKKKEGDRDIHLSSHRGEITPVRITILFRSSKDSCTYAPYFPFSSARHTEILDTVAPLTLYRGFIGNSSSRSSLENLSSVLDTKDLGIRGKGIRF